ncbi:VirB8/TrbF family protein [Rhizobium beringeri]
MLSFSVAQLFSARAYRSRAADQRQEHRLHGDRDDTRQGSIERFRNSGRPRLPFVGNYVIRRETYDPRYLSENFDMIASGQTRISSAFKDYSEDEPSNQEVPRQHHGTIRRDLAGNPVGQSAQPDDDKRRYASRRGSDSAAARLVNRRSATVRYKQINLPASNRVRLYNPLGFVVTEYVKVPETMPSGLVHEAEDGWSYHSITRQHHRHRPS